MNNIEDENVKTENNIDKGQETTQEWARRLYTSPGGSLMGWLLEEAENRGQNQAEMAAEIGTTYGYISQLRNGVRNSAHISQNVAESCAKYLDVSTISNHA